MSSIIAGFALLLLSALLGASFAKKITDKKNFYKALLSFNHDLLIEVEFQKNDLISLLSRSYSSDDFNELLTQKSNLIKGDCFELIFPKYLKNSEHAELKDYFSKIGMQDSITASSFLKRYGQIFSGIYSEILQEEKVKGALYKRMGVIIGIIACIIVI